MRRASRTLVGVLAAVVLAVVLPSGPAAAQDEPAQAEVTLLGLTGLLGPGSRPPPEDGADVTVEELEALDDLSVDVAVTNGGVAELASLRLTVGLHPPVPFRSTLHDVLDDGELDSRPLETQTIDLDTTVPPGETLATTVTIPGADVPWPDQAAVLPLTVGLFDGSEQLDTLTTAVVWLASAPRATLQGVVVLPLGGETSVTTTGTYPATTLPAAAPGSPLRTLLAVLEGRLDAPLVVAPDVALVEELAGRAGGYTADDGTAVPGDAPAAAQAAATLEALTAVVRGLPLDPVLGPYADADVAAMASARSSPGVAALADEAIRTARTRLQGLVGRAPDLGTYDASGRTTPAVVDLVRDQRIILPYDQTQGPPAANEPDLPPALGVVAGDGGVEPTAMVTDPHVDAVLTDTTPGDGVVARAQRLRAELAQLWLEAPNRDRLVVVRPPDGWGPAPRLVEAWLDVLLVDPWMTPTGPRQAVEAVRAGGTTGSTPVVPLGASATATPSSLLATLGNDLRLLAALEAASGDITTADRPVSLPALGDAILRATSLLTSEPSTAAARLEDVRRLLEDGFGEVTIADGAQITLTSETGELPITLQRVEGGPINVVVEVESAGRLVWEGDGQRQRLQLPPTSSRTVSFSTRAISRGTFPVTVTVLDPTETRVLTTATVSVRSTAISVPALWIIGALVVGLLVYGRVRRRRPTLQLVDSD